MDGVMSAETVSQAREMLAEILKQRDAAAQHMSKASGDAFIFWSRIHRELYLAEGTIENFLEWEARA